MNNTFTIGIKVRLNLPIASNIGGTETSTVYAMPVATEKHTKIDTYCAMESVLLLLMLYGFLRAIVSVDSSEF